ncbi:MAG: LptA/OstA family protein [Desulfovibrio sp.]|jgi:lipopolysaccharide export system protein LptA|nr:LptA/OstA family protein [Desulfovibrio sp.]
MTSKLHLYLCFSLLAVLMLSQPAFAEDSRSKDKIPTSITSGRMDYNADALTVLFSGNVHVVRPDFELWSDKMTVHLDKSTQKPAGSSESGGMEGGDIDRIVAEGSVRLRSENRSGTCNKATYYAKNDRFVMEGAPRLQDERQSIITGGTIVHHFATNHSEVLNSAGVTFYTPDKSEGSGANKSTGPNPASKTRKAAK